MPITHDTPWRRPGRAAYARRRIRAALRPPITVHPAPADLVIEHNVAVTMRDGVVLRVNVYRPAGEGPLPVLLCEHPYGKDSVPKKNRRGWSVNLQYRIMNQPAPVQISSQTGWEAPDPVWWAARGYVVINADARGADTSDREGSLLSDAEAADIYDLIEWAGHQAWSNGNVGMLGVSYLAISQYKAAALDPPSLKAICPWEGFTDPYRDFMTPGGIAERGFATIWLRMSRHIARLADDIGAQRGRHPLRDSWWQSLAPALEKITVPMLVCASFSDANVHSVGSLRAFEQVSSPDRFVYMHRGPKWATFYGDEAKAAQKAFFDRFLCNQNLPKPPRVRLEVRENRDRITQVRTENEWPLARTEWHDLFLSDSGQLADAPPTASGKVTFDLRRNAAAFNVHFTTETEITGPMSLSLWASIGGAADAEADASLFVGVEKWSGPRCVPFEGSYGYGRDRVAIGRQRISLRELDGAASAPHRPEHTFLTRQLVTNGQVVQVEIPLSASSTLYRAGESLRLLVAGRYLEPRNPLFGHFPAYYPPSPRGSCTLHWGPDRPARLQLPIIPQD